MRLVCAPDSRGRSCLREQSFRAPIHLSKPFWEENNLILNVVNPTAGLMEGDRIYQEAIVKSGASLLLTMPGASRAHRTPSGWAEMEQRFVVEAGASLEVLPEIFIPQAGAHYRQSTKLEVAEDATLFFVESIAPGRTASGESFQYQRLDWHTDLWVGGRYTLRERLQMDPKMASIRAVRRRFPSAYYAGIIALGKKKHFLSDPFKSTEDLQTERTWIGRSRLPESTGWALRLLSQQPTDLRLTINLIRETFYHTQGLTAPGLRRVAGR